MKDQHECPLPAKLKDTLGYHLQFFRTGQARQSGFEGNKLEIDFAFFLTSWDVQLLVATEIRISLDFECAQKGWVANGPNFEWYLQSGSPTI